MKALISNDLLAVFKDAHGIDLRVERRQTGRSTAQGLKAIHDAIYQPGEPVPIRDHYGTHEANKLLAMKINTLIDKLELRGFEITKKPMGYYLTFHLFEKEVK